MAYRAKSFDLPFPQTFKRKGSVMTFMGSIYMVWFLIEEYLLVIHISHFPLVCVPCEPYGSAGFSQWKWVRGVVQ